MSFKQVDESLASIISGVALVTPEAQEILESFICWIWKVGAAVPATP